MKLHNSLAYGLRESIFLYIDGGSWPVLAARECNAVLDGEKGY